MRVPGRLPAAEREEDLHRPEHRAGAGDRQPEPQAAGHRGRGRGRRGPQHVGAQQVELYIYLFIFLKQRKRIADISEDCFYFEKEAEGGSYLKCSILLIYSIN